MWPDRVSNPGPLTYESCALPTALRSLRKGNRVISTNRALGKREYQGYFKDNFSYFSMKTYVVTSH